VKKRYYLILQGSGLHTQGEVRHFGTLRCVIHF